jgi:hemoglobin
MTTPRDPAPATPPPPPRLPARAPEGAAPLLERVGGRDAVERIVDRFYDAVQRDALLRPLFPADLGPGREKQKLFFEQWLGGEPRYSERYGHPRLRMRHFPFVIDDRAAGRWLRLFAEAMRDSAVGEQEIAEVLAGLGPLARHMVNAGDNVPRAPLGDAFLT